MKRVLADSSFLVALGIERDPRHAELDPDFTDAAIVWLAEKTGCRAILTVDVRDFSVYRLGKGKRFERVKWFER